MKGLGNNLFPKYARIKQNTIGYNLYSFIKNTLPFSCDNRDHAIFNIVFFDLEADLN